jgi:endonuclease/exonuclease/phosphatase (EEP) superfamily protein YafD
VPAIVLALIVGCAWAVGQVFRDLTAWTALLFYLPSIGVAVLSAPLAVWAWRQRRRLPTWAAAAPAVLFAASLGATWGENPRLFAAGSADLSSVTDAPGLRLVHWNVCRGCLGWDEALADMRTWDADLLVLSEYPKRMEVKATAAALGPAYQGRRFGTLALFARDAKTGVESLLNEYELEVHRISFERPTDPPLRLRLLAVDVVASPRVPRDPQLLRIQQSIAREKPDLVVGDFNAPRRSWRLSRLPDGYRDAYDVAGAGWAGTWPSPLPIWSLDHVLAGPGVRVRSYRLPLSWRSDHRPQLVEVEVPRRPEQ